MKLSLFYSVTFCNIFRNLTAFRHTEFNDTLFANSDYSVFTFVHFYIT